MDETIAAKATRIAARPIDRIDGVFLDAMDPALVRQTSGRCEKNLSIAKTPIVIASRRYWRGLGVDCPSRISVSLDGKYRRFQALAGLDSAIMNNYMDRSAIAFEVWVDGQKRWDSGPVRNADPAEPARLVDVDVAGAKSLELVVVPQDAHGHIAQNFADWAKARLSLASESGHGSILPALTHWRQMATMDRTTGRRSRFPEKDDGLLKELPVMKAIIRQAKTREAEH